MIFRVLGQVVLEFRRHKTPQILLFMSAILLLLLSSFWLMSFGNGIKENTAFRYATDTRCP